MNKVLVETIDGFEIYFEAVDEICPINILFPENYQSIADDIDAGKSELFCACVSARSNGIELATSYLGGCVYESVEAFYTTYKTDSYLDMRTDVIIAARSIITELHKVHIATPTRVIIHNILTLLNGDVIRDGEMDGDPVRLVDTKDCTITVDSFNDYGVEVTEIKHDDTGSSIEPDVEYEWGYEDMTIEQLRMILGWLTEYKNIKA